jgi:hypothetical protein
MKFIEFFIGLIIAVVLLGVAAHFINNVTNMQKQAKQASREESTVSEYGLKNCKRIVSLTPEGNVDIGLADGAHSIDAGIGICVDPETSDATIDSEKESILSSAETIISKFRMKDIFLETSLGEEEDNNQEPPRLAGNNDIERMNSLRAEVLYGLKSEFPFITEVFFTSFSAK